MRLESDGIPGGVFNVADNDNTQSKQRLKMLYLRDIFLKYTSEGHPITRAQIESLLGEQGINEGRKAFAEDIEALRDYGMDIQSTTGRTAAYQLVSREFELAELKLLADAVNSSKSLTMNQSKTLTRKLSTLCSERDAQQLRRNIYVSGRTKQPNKGVLYNIDTIHRAISGEGKRFRLNFRYYEYDMAKKRKYRDKIRSCSPYSLVWDNEHYYLIAWNDHRECYSNYRVDRMEDVRITDIPARPIDPDFDLEKYVASHISMFSGETVEVRLRCERNLVNAVLDRFGMGVRMLPEEDGEHFSVFVDVAPQPPFYAWVFQFGGAVKIISPENVAGEYREMLDRVREGL